MMYVAYYSGDIEINVDVKTIANYLIICEWSLWFHLADCSEKKNPCGKRFTVMYTQKTRRKLIFNSRMKKLP